MKIVAIGDNIVPSQLMERLLREELSKFNPSIECLDWTLESFDEFQEKCLLIEKFGPDVLEIPKEFQSTIKDAEVLVVHYCPVSASVIENSPKLKLIGCCRGGYENVNIDYARKKGIVVVNAPGRSANAVAEFTIGLIIAESRNIARGHYALKNGIWRKNYANDEYRKELYDKVIGIIGFGNIGRRVARLLKAFNVKTILVYDPYLPNEEIIKAGCEPADLRRIFRESDFITIHARLTKENANLINRELISLMKRSAYIINTARAGLVDYNALYEALKERRIAGAALDVFDLEPLPPNSPLLELDNITLTPHLAGDTIETRLNGIRMISEEIAAFLEGRLLRNRVV